MPALLQQGWADLCPQVRGRPVSHLVFISTCCCLLPVGWGPGDSIRSVRMGGTRGPPHCSQEAPVALGEGASLAWGVCVCDGASPVLSAFLLSPRRREGGRGSRGTAGGGRSSGSADVGVGAGWLGWKSLLCPWRLWCRPGWGVATVQQPHRTEVSAQHSAFAGRWGGPGGTMVVVFSCLPGVKQFLCEVFCPVVRESGLLLDISLAPVGVSEWTAYSSSGLGIAEASRWSAAHLLESSYVSFMDSVRLHSSRTEW